MSLHETLLKEGASAGLNNRTVPHLCGRFPAINVGAMHGKGTVNPIDLSTEGNSPIVVRLLKNPHVRRLAAFASCRRRFISFFPRISPSPSRFVVLICA